jgi:hypothetical protein|tara:strand:- start:249 stop:2105 length:1857 start_codon:yes stop_codon:yes gene_type:complete
MADPKTVYEYGRTPEETAPGLLGLFNFLRGPLVDAFTPERREVITPPKTTYQEIDDYAYRRTTPGVYGEPERDLEYMPVVQGARSAYDFAGKLLSDGKFREQTGSRIARGIDQLFADYIGAGTQLGEPTYDPVAKREVALDPLLPLGMGMAASIVAPVKATRGSMVTGMFAGRQARTADLDKLKVAEEMAKKGRPREDIWKETGWFRWHRDGEPVSDWRFEISDLGAEAVFNPRVQTPTGRLRPGEKPVLSDLLRHPKLYEAFPGPVRDLGAQKTRTSFEGLTAQRAAIKKELDDLNKRIKDRKSPEYESEYQKLQDKDKEAIESFFSSENISLPPADKEGLPKRRSFYQTEAERMETPLSSIPLYGMPSKQWGGANYSPSRDEIGLKARPGQPMPRWTERVPWDKEGKYIQPFTPAQYLKHLEKTQDAFRDAGLSLDSGIAEGRTVYSISENPSRSLHPKGGALVNPEDLPDYLKKLWDGLQAYGKIYYRKDYDPGEEFRSLALHEGQHSIQYRTEGWEGGGHPSEFKGKRAVKDRKTGKKLGSVEAYMRTLGEMEARLVQSRRDFTDGQRQERLPWTKEGGLDRTESQIILRSDPGVPPSHYKSAGGLVVKPLYDD